MKRIQGRNFYRTFRGKNTFPSGISLFVVLISILLPLTACKGRGLDTIDISINGHRLTVEVAGTDSERSQGLMDRKSLKNDQGMLFVYDRDQKMSFWMKNTSIPLSIAFISKEGVIKEIADMTPLSEKIVESSHSVRYALEVNRGVFEKLGAKPGDTVIFPAEF